MQQLWVWSLVQGVPQAAKQRGPWTTTADPVLWSLGATLLKPTGPGAPDAQHRSHRGEKPEPRGWPPLSTTRERPMQQRGPGPAMKKSTKHASSSHSVLILPPRWPLCIPDGIACRKWTETSGYICAACAHLRPPWQSLNLFFPNGETNVCEGITLFACFPANYF